MDQSNKNLGRATLVFLLLLGVCGCGSDRPTVVPASGVVLLDGEPIDSGGSVMFQPENGRHSRAVIEPDGSFVMTTFNRGDGATPGTQMVRVVSMKKQTVDEDGEEIVGASLLPKKYGNFRTSGVEVVVPPGGSDSLVIELKRK